MKSLNKSIIIKVGVLLAGAALCVAGIMRGELTVIMRKAVVVCLECIGIG